MKKDKYIPWLMGHKPNATYNTWDKLMPVIERIEALGFITNNLLLNIKKKKHYFSIRKPAGNDIIVEVRTATKFGAYTQAALAFCIWYERSSFIVNKTSIRNNGTKK